jgi:hypothetical protein
LHEASSVSSQVGNNSATYQSGYDDMTIIQSNDSFMIEKPFQECERDILEIVTKKVLQRVQG